MLPPLRVMRMPRGWWPSIDTRCASDPKYDIQTREARRRREPFCRNCTEESGAATDSASNGTRVQQTRTQKHFPSYHAPRPQSPPRYVDDLHAPAPPNHIQHRALCTSLRVDSTRPAAAVHPGISATPLPPRLRPRPERTGRAGRGAIAPIAQPLFGFLCFLPGEPSEAAIVPESHSSCCTAAPAGDLAFFALLTSAVELPPREVRKTSTRMTNAPPMPAWTRRSCASYDGGAGTSSMASSNTVSLNWSLSLLL
mmetsp:Transcript_24120/g.54879  ORF Transcript_24120/g.54879 Transcript_24120/m.54879 type:complete len:254 (+) Transcript_24120:257-1018(+)